jgi:hypothetical protein
VGRKNDGHGTEKHGWVERMVGMGWRRTDWTEKDELG